VKLLPKAGEACVFIICARRRMMMPLAAAAPLSAEFPRRPKLWLSSFFPTSPRLWQQTARVATKLKRCHLTLTLA
jgi:hypothetical protein